jgi:hypothetical protein
MALEISRALGLEERARARALELARELEEAGYRSDGPPASWNRPDVLSLNHHECDRGQNRWILLGVRRAVDRVVHEIKKGRGPFRVYGPLVHNPQVLRALKERGVCTVENPWELRTALSSSEPTESPGRRGPGSRVFPWFFGT